MQSMGETLINQVRHFQAATGQASMTVIVQKHDGGMGIHQVGYEPSVGLLVDGKPPSVQWYQTSEEFHPLEWAPTVLH